MRDREHSLDPPKRHCPPAEQKERRGGSRRHHARSESPSEEQSDTDSSSRGREKRRLRSKVRSSAGEVAVSSLVSLPSLRLPVSFQLPP